MKSSRGSPRYFLVVVDLHRREEKGGVRRGILRPEFLDLCEVTYTWALQRPSDDCSYDAQARRTIWQKRSSKIVSVADFEYSLWLHILTALRQLYRTPDGLNRYRRFRRGILLVPRCRRSFRAMKFGERRAAGTSVRHHGGHLLKRIELAHRGALRAAAFAFRPLHRVRPPRCTHSNQFFGHFRWCLWCFRTISVVCSVF